MIGRLDSVFGHAAHANQSAKKNGLGGLNPDGWLAQTMAGFVGSIALSPLMLLPVLVYAYDEHLGFGPDMAGRISSAALIGLALATVLVSLRTKHWSMTRVSVVGMIIMLVFTALTLVMHDAKTFFVLTLLAGFGGGLTQAAVAAALSRTKNAERAFAIFTCFQFVYPGLGAYFFPRILDSSDMGFNLMQSGQLVLIAAALVLAPVMGAFRLRSDLRDADDVGANKDQMEWALLLRGPAILSIIGIMIYGASNGAIWAYSEGIGRLSGLDVLAIGDIIAYANIVAGLAALGVAWLGNRLGHFIPLIGGILGQLLSMYVYMAFPTEAGYIAGTLIFCVSWAIVFPYFLSIQSDLDHSGTVVAFGQFTNLVGTAFGPALAAAYVGQEGDFAAAIWISEVMTVMALVPMVLIPILYRKKLALH
ncbi:MULTISPECIES: MFS transporter [Paracoccus]|uniref:MFS transporter n=1 Tax=Paracoccus litorisediminis TaxID=2006130 RepID=A0A844HJW4_9RHOB|nr:MULTISPECIES: MFS transporter [Paracoccus]MBD9527300.1 MFS transporter [Paracoccus sp. PAR01]MTH60473.1 MFS transporter [Paracoccus litorisediminis]